MKYYSQRHFERINSKKTYAKIILVLGSIATGLVVYEVMLFFQLMGLARTY